MTTEEDMLRLYTQVRHLEEANAIEAGRVKNLRAEIAKLHATIRELRAELTLQRSILTHENQPPDRRPPRT